MKTVNVKDMIPGVPYQMGIGEIQLDGSNGLLYYKSSKGEIEQVNPSGTLKVGEIEGNDYTTRVVSLTLGFGDLVRLRKMVIKDTDTADKHALNGILWEIAQKAGICDDEGNLIEK